MKNDDPGQPNVEIEIIEDNLHDLMNLLHSGIILPLEEMEEWLKEGNFDKIHEILPSLILRAKSIFNEVKEIQANILQPRERKTDDLLISLQELSTIWLSRAGLQNKRTIFVDCDQPIELSELTHQAFLAIADEGISNAIKYSGFMSHPETKISIKVESKNKFVTMEIQDDGYGEEKVTEGYGLKKIRRILSELRYTGLESSLEIITSRGNGFVLKVNVEISKIE